MYIIARNIKYIGCLIGTALLICCIGCNTRKISKSLLSEKERIKIDFREQEFRDAIEKRLASYNKGKSSTIETCEDSIYYDDDNFFRAQFWMDIPKDSDLSANYLSLLQEQCNEVILQKVGDWLKEPSIYAQGPNNDLYIRPASKIPQFIVTKNSNACLTREEKGISMMVEVNKEKLVSDFCEIREHIQESSSVVLIEEEKAVDFIGDVSVYGSYKTGNEQEWAEIKKAVEEDEQKAFLLLIFKYNDHIIKAQEKNIKELEARIKELQDLIVSREPEKVKEVIEEWRKREKETMIPEGHFVKSTRKAFDKNK